MPLSQRDARIAQECSASDEPCIVFRAKDVLLPQLLETYAREAEFNGCDSDFVDAVRERWQQVVDWQLSNPDITKTPDLREGESTS